MSGETMNWYKALHGMPFDTRLAVIARRSGLSRAETLALWVALLDHASRNTPQGNVRSFDAEEISVALEIESSRVALALESLREKGLIQADHLLKDWNRHAPASSAARVRRFRQRQHAAASVTKTKPCNPDDARRKRLQETMAARHVKRGRTLAPATPGDVP